VLFHGRRSEVVALYRAPEILLHIAASHSACIINEVSNVEQQLFRCAGIVKFQDCAWNDADVEFFGEVAVFR